MLFVKITGVPGFKPRLRRLTLLFTIVILLICGLMLAGGAISEAISVQQQIEKLEKFLQEKPDGFDWNTNPLEAHYRHFLRTPINGSVHPLKVELLISRQV